MPAKRPSARFLRVSVAGFLLLALMLGPSRLNQQTPKASVTQLYTLYAATPRIKPGCDPILPEHLRPLVDRVAIREGLAPDLLMTVILRESAFQPCAISRTGARGLMQLMPDTAVELGVRDAFDPAENLAGGARFLGKLVRRYDGNLALALSAYHVGPGAVDPRKPSVVGPSTKRYVSDILRMLDRLKPANASST